MSYGDLSVNPLFTKRDLRYMHGVQSGLRMATAASIMQEMEARAKVRQQVAVQRQRLCPLPLMVEPIIGTVVDGELIDDNGNRIPLELCINGFSLTFVEEADNDS